MDSFQIIQRAALKIKFLAEWLRCKTLARVVCVQDRLLELLFDSFLVQAGDIKTVEVCLLPKLALLQLLIKDHLVSEGHNAKIGFSWEEPTSWFEEHISSNNVCLKHALV